MFTVRYCVLLCIVALGSLLSDQAVAAIITVSGTASGSFGAPVSGSTDFVLGHTFTGGGESIAITASGTVFTIGSSFPAGPTGITMQRSFILGAFPQAFTPLEEAFVDGGTPPPISNPSSNVTNIAALLGVFVPDTTALLPGFQPRDNDLVALGIPSNGLFLIGTGPTIFTSPGPGRLYLGINEPFVSNNSGFFQVTVVPVEVEVPEPSALILCAIGGICLWTRRWRSRNQTI